jgi:hypothetical protein
MTMATNPPRPAKPGSLDDEPYVQGDPIPVPEAIEKNSEASWRLWSELAATENRRYADTAPMSAPASVPKFVPGRPIQPAVSAGRSLLDKLMLETKRGNRVCPKPAQWQQLYEILAARAPAGGGAPIPLPLLGQAWSQTTSLAKRLAFKDHIEWASSHGQTDEVYAFLKGLSEEMWHHMGE